MSDASTEILDYRNDNGNGWKFFKYDGVIRPILGGKSPEDIIKLADSLRQTELRDDDIMIAAYPKCGTHWLWQITNMIKSGSTEYNSVRKEGAMIGMVMSAKLDELPSPRMLNSHVNFRNLPDLLAKKIKTILVFRNPKDVSVSYYNHLFGLGKTPMGFNGNFTEFLDLFLEGKIPCGSYFDYIRDWQQVERDHPDLPLLIIFYEDMKKKPVETVKAVADFLECPVDDAFCSKILDACSFSKMKTVDKDGADKNKMMTWKEGHGMYRKGQIGDWKNWLTVAQNERFDYLLDKEMKTIPFTFTYQ